MANIQKSSLISQLLTSNCKFDVDPFEHVDTFSDDYLREAVSKLLPARMAKEGIEMTAENCDAITIETQPTLLGGAKIRVMWKGKTLLSSEEIDGLKRHVERDYLIQHGLPVPKKQKTPIINGLLGLPNDDDPFEKDYAAEGNTTPPPSVKQPVKVVDTTVVSVILQKVRRTLG